MKQLITILLIMVSAAIVRGQNRVFTITVNSKDYHVDEKQMNDFFGSAFQDMVDKAKSKPSNFELWKDSFEDWKTLAASGRLTVSTYGNIFGNTQYQGVASKEDLGLKDNGKSATGNGNKKTNRAVRMATLNYYLLHYIINNVTEYKVNW
jgi:hypothetical protein